MFLPKIVDNIYNIKLNNIQFIFYKLHYTLNPDKFIYFISYDNKLIDV